MFRTIAVAVLVVFVTLGGRADANPPGPDPKVQSIPRLFGSELTAVNACVRTVRQASPHGRFDAYVNPYGKLRINGTADETAQFRRCLKDKGVLLD